MNTITGLIGVAMFLAFIGGLAQSIGALPFIIIVIAISTMAIYDYYESVKSERSQAIRQANVDAKENEQS
ncbi:MAG: hypothetical protein OEW37_02365 [Rhodospirillaceae bacterium]|nr:hypothetical protein [Rhodospirillaceae bacterium]